MRGPPLRILYGLMIHRAGRTLARPRGFCYNRVRSLRKFPRRSMFFRPTLLIATLTLCAVAVAAQTPAPVRSHVERFSTVEERAERVEAEAGSKIAADPRDAASLNSRGVARLFLGRYKEAAEDLARAVALRPESADYQSNLGSALWKVGRVEQAVAAERAAVKLDEKNFSAHYQLGRFLMRLGDKERVTEAATHLRRAAEIDPRQYDVRFELIAAYRALGDRAQASNQLDFLSDARPSDPRVFYTSALLATDRDDVEAAVRDFKEALRRDPTLSGAWQDLGVAYVKLKRWNDAVETFAELARLRPDSVDAAYLHALALFNAGRAEDSEREARRALRINAGAAEAHTLLGVILASRGTSNAEAAESLAQAAALRPESFDAHFYLGRVLYALKDTTGAVRELRAASVIDPRHAETRFFLGTALEAVGDSDAAMVEYAELVKLDPRSAFGLVGQGALLVKQGKIEEAVAALKSATTLDPKNFEARLALGRAHALAGRYEEAVESLKAAAALAPYRSDAHYQLGLALRRLGREEEAKREFDTVNRLNTEFRTGATTRQ
ncbi:MAG: protein O-GlcNAc transferase [Acidobacteriota bacterium]|nr:protein O-GlcNAc transferase [Acidobacteriota bacterium]